MTTHELIIPQGMENIYQQKLYSPGVRVGNLLFVSGMLGRDAELNIIHEIEAQFVQLFENMKLVLEAGVASQPLLASFEEFLRPTVIKAFRDAFPAAQSRDALLAAQAFEDNADFIFRRILLSRLAPDVPDHLLGGCFRAHGFLSHLRSLRSLR